MINEWITEQATKIIFQNYVDKDWAEADCGERVWALGTTRAAFAVFEKAYAEIDNSSDCAACGGESYHHTIECYTGQPELPSELSSGHLGGADAQEEHWSNYDKSMEGDR